LERDELCEFEAGYGVMKGYYSHRMDIGIFCKYVLCGRCIFQDDAKSNEPLLKPWTEVAPDPFSLPLSNGKSDVADFGPNNSGRSRDQARLNKVGARLGVQIK
jgi:hypothetical protein